MNGPSTLGGRLRHLADLLRDPFRRSQAAEQAIADPVTAEVLGPAFGPQALLALLRQDPGGDLARVVILLLCLHPSNATSAALLSILGGADQTHALAFEPGLWRRPDGEQAVARDIIQVVETFQNPAPLILLQRPAAAAVKRELQELVRQRRRDFAEYAMAALSYASEPGDLPFFTEVASWLDRPGLCAPAGIELLRFGETKGWPGVQAGLTAPDEDLRVATFAALHALLPEDARQTLRFDPGAAVGSQQAQIARLRDALIENMRKGDPRA